MKNIDVKNLVTIAEQRIGNNGGSLQITMPKILRDMWRLADGDILEFLRESNDAPVIIRVKKKAV